MQEHLLYGAAYYYEYLPVDRMEEDFCMMNKAGINTIRIAESTWSTWEPKDGVFDFSMLHKVLKAADAHGLSVIVGTPTYALPSWLVKKYPDVLSDTHAGPCRYGPRQNFDITHPGYLFHAERIIRRLLEEVKDYDCVIGFQLDNETKHYDTCSERAQKLFREYLKKKFGSLQELNRQMGFAYWSNSIADWDDLPDVRGTINASFGAEYEYFQRSLVTEFLMWQRRICDEYRRPDQFVTQNFDFDWRGYSYGLQPDVNQFDAAEALTISGCDIYHPSEHLLTGAEIAFGGAMAYAFKQSNYLVMETEAQGNFGWLPYPGQLRLQAFAHLASGADGISYWHWHSIHNAAETYWKGILSHDFSAGAVYREVMTIGRDFARLSEQLLHLKKKNRTAILVSNRSLNGLKWFPTCQQGLTPEHSYNDYLRWVCDACYRLNIEYDLVNDTARDFSIYDVVIAPVLYSAEDTLIDSLLEYTRQGGRLIATFKSFFSDEILKVRHDAQPHRMTGCFGMTYDRFTRPVNVTLASGSVKLPENCRVTDWMELLETPAGPDQNILSDTPVPNSPISAPETADKSDLPDHPGLCEVLCTYSHPAWGGIPAVTLNTYGKGQAVYMGCCFESSGLEALMEYLFRRWDLPLSAERFPVIIRRGTNAKGDQIIYCLNFSGQKQTFSAPETGTELLSAVPVTKGEALELEPWGIKILCC